MSDTPSSTHKSWLTTILGAVLWVITGTGAGIVSHFLPDTWVAVLHAIGELVTAIGAATQVHQNTQAAVATKEAVKQVTNAPVDLSPNPAIAAARASASRVAGNPLQGG
jgi:hypothetical protein